MFGMGYGMGGFGGSCCCPPVAVGRGCCEAVGIIAIAILILIALGVIF